MSRVSQAQMIRLLDLLSEDGVLVHGKVMYTNTNKQTFWKQIALQLNSVEGGVYKNIWKWCKMWADWKNKTKKKANILLRKKNHNYKSHIPTLTNLELRLLRMIEYPIDEKIELPESVKNMELLDKTEDKQLCFLNEENEYWMDKDKTTSEEDNTTLEHYAKNKYKTDNKIHEENTGLFNESSGSEKKVKIKVKKIKKKKHSFEEFKIRTKLALEKDKVLHKSEELRLKAVELKLKGEELRLKEIEMNKINYLTNIEEEKVKCLRDISTSLKEILDRTRNGNLRFHSII